jgi:DNA polymerase III subunit chi
MTEVAFHFNADDKLGYTCRLVRKAVGSGARVVVTGAPETLGALDTALWTFATLDFIAHCRADAAPAQLARSPVVLATHLEGTPHQQVLVNLGSEVPQGFERFERLIEVVTGDDADKQAARGRWNHYKHRGYAIAQHDLVQKGAA